MKMSWEELDGISMQFYSSTQAAWDISIRIREDKSASEFLKQIVPTSKDPLWDTQDRIRWMRNLRNKALEEGWDISVEDAQEFVRIHKYGFVNNVEQKHHFDGLRYKWMYQNLREGLTDNDKIVFQLLNYGYHPSRYEEGMPKWYYMLQSYGEVVKGPDEWGNEIGDAYFNEVVKPYLEEVEQTLKTVKEI